METIKHYRSCASLCRQRAALHPEASWHWLAEAERYEYLADARVAEHFEERHAGEVDDAELAAA